MSNFREPTTRFVSFNRIVARTLFYPTLAWNIFNSSVLGRYAWWSQVNTHLFLGALPLRQHVPVLQSLDVKAIINMCEEYEGPIDLYHECDIEQLRIPVIDFVPPTIEQIQQGVEFIESHVQQGHSVYIHCKAGRARSATIVLCWLVKSGHTKEAAQQLIQESRHQVYSWIHERPVVLEFVRLLRRGKN